MRLRDRYWRLIQAEIQRVLDEVFYRPLADVLGEDEFEITNAWGALHRAVVEGRVWYDDGAFRGDFSAAITLELRQLGAKFFRKTATWSLARDLVPPEVSTAQAVADSRYESLKRDFLVTLDQIKIKSIDRHAKLEDRYSKAIEWLDDDFEKTVKAITIPPVLTDEQRTIIARDWSKNLELHIKGWTAENIIALREKVQSNAFDGRRASDLVSLLKENYGVGQRKAEFLARQETALLMSKFQESRYASVGVRRYRWSGANDARERPDHRELNNKIFSFDDPPVTDRRTGARNNPGEDYNCRCIAVPIIE